MPKRGNRPATWQEHFRKRLIAEQGAQGITDMGLAERVSRKYPMTPSTVWKIKNADPPRKVDMDEVMALVDALGYGDVYGFLNGRGPDSKINDALWAAEGNLTQVQDLARFAEAELVTQLGHPVDMPLKVRDLPFDFTEAWASLAQQWGAEAMDAETRAEVVARLEQHTELIAETADSFKSWSKGYISNVRRLADAIEEESD